ncbi:Hypothetical predicted protein [Mytilus galloprovincialis]|uniref:Uncharacterized protein n=1 Tax=Mytilus galloprovincialis TaxID=29158 RepID=A0A8B6FJI4_MYTGA|nr:Hypothetical predicted protein [Mytilus galloprovincialis]
MKIAFALLVILPMAFSMPEKRLILDSLLQGAELKTLVDGIVGQLGSDASEQACEAECHTLIQQDHLLQFGCPLICKSCNVKTENLLRGAELKTLVDGIVGQLDSDASEQACETECHTLIQQDHLLQFGCPLTFYKAHRFGHPKASPTAAP